MEIISVHDLNPGDTILIPGLKNEEILAVTVEKVTDDFLIIPLELGGVDYTPDNFYEIIRLCRSGEETTINILSDNIGYR